MGGREEEMEIGGGRHEKQMFTFPSFRVVSVKLPDQPRSGEKRREHKGSTSLKNPNTAESSGSLEETFDAKLHLDTGSSSRNKPNTSEPYKSQAEPCGAKLPLETGSPSQKKPSTAEPNESLKNISGKKVAEDTPKLKPNEYLDYYPKYYKTMNGLKYYTEVVPPKKKKKPKAKAVRGNSGFGDKGEDMEDAFFREFEEMETTSRQFASAALSILHEQGHNLELVKPGLYELEDTTCLTYAVRGHFNFKAKKKDDPSAPVETYFGQLMYRGDSDIEVECCVSIGESDSLPYARDNRGCGICTEFVHHPLGGCKGIKWGLYTYSYSLKGYTIM